MAIKLSQQDFDEMVMESEQINPPYYNHSDLFDTTYKLPNLVGDGYVRWIDLQPGIFISIEDVHIARDVLFKLPEREHVVKIECFSYLGESQLYGNGIAPKETILDYEGERELAVRIEISAEMLQSFLARQSEPIPPAVTQLLRFNQPQVRSPISKLTLGMQGVLQQLVHCPYRGLTKKMYLESKAMELMTLQLDQLLEAQDSELLVCTLNSDDIDRIYRAKDILLRQLDNPPSLTDLARQVGLNSRALKEGFRRVFGNPVFSYLHQHRLERSRQLLEAKEMKVSQVADAVGFASRSHFAQAFRQSFGVNPKDYQMQRRKFR